ncbi:GntR family transcriptional regulator [uncultured Tateyamaria sp.]|uniref:GntR family transcriptional regulator n=1 Tax=uncultured Tateyamaria sp. TaxID=455651 RepID=UPI00260BC073|nr:GntR family transcriptional regulator [uncultured Tateyamaria sp.]
MQVETLPKYERAYRVILDRLRAGRYPVGGRMPTESELASHFDVSRVTIRKALDMLVQDGYVESKQGSGYTVLTLSPASDTCLTSFTDAMLRAGREPTSRFVSIDRFAPGAPETSTLPPEMRGSEITRVVRLRMVDGEPTMLVMTYAPSALLHEASPADFPETGPEQSILRILQARFHLEWSAACEDISPVLADADMAQTFRIDEGTPLLRQACSAYDDNGAMVFHEDVYRNGPLSFSLTQASRKPRYPLRGS